MCAFNKASSASNKESTVLCNAATSWPRSKVEWSKAKSSCLVGLSLACAGGGGALGFGCLGASLAPRFAWSLALGQIPWPRLFRRYGLPRRRSRWRLLRSRRRRTSRDLLGLLVPLPQRRGGVQQLRGGLFLHSIGVSQRIYRMIRTGNAWTDAGDHRYSRTRPHEGIAQDHGEF